ncbi:MAG TPA: isoaspartyl peptidase/L-asparaginase [bacterium]|nr:isoaspartyl peptidase/L-asparaginase [bacterium]
MIQPVLIIQGGAGKAFRDKKRAARVRGKMARIVKLAYKKLCQTNALEAATYAVKLLEDDRDFNAGTGSQLQADGVARLSASVMDGGHERFAAVINLEKIKNPVLVARSLLAERDRILCGKEAVKFARTLGLKTLETRTKASIRHWLRTKEEACDTVGACALDRYGLLASATSTGGRGFERPGRVSDSGMPVANFADRGCAISATGIGEEIIEEGLAIKIATRVRDGLPLRQAFAKTFREVRSRFRKMGAIGVDAKGRVTWSKTTDVLIYAWQKGKKTGIFD